MRDKILLFIPGYNCEKQIIRVLGQLDQETVKYFSEIIMVNNRSTDQTEEVVKGFIEKHPYIPLKLLRNNDNYGLGGSHKVAFSYAKEHGFDYVVVLHGDDQGTLADILPALKKGLHRKHDCVLGARFMKGSRLTGYSLFRTFGNVVYDFLFAAVVKKKIYDLGSGLNVYSVKMLEDSFYEKFPDNLMFNYCMILASQYYAHDICFYPISWREDDQVSNVKMVNQAVTVLRMLYEYWSNPMTIEQDYREHEIKDYEAEVIV